MPTPKIIDTKQINNEYVAYCIQVDNDPFEISWHTLHILSPDHAAQLAAISTDIITRYTAMLQWRTNCTALIATADTQMAAPAAAKNIITSIS